MKKASKITMIILSVIMMLTTTVITAFADNTIIVEQDSIGRLKMNGYYCPDIITFEQDLEPYPDGSEQREDKAVLSTVSKMQYSTITNSEYNDLMNLIDITWNDFRYIEILGTYNGNLGSITSGMSGYQDCSTWNRLRYANGDILYYTTLSAAIFEQYAIRTPTYWFEYDDIVYDQSATQGIQNNASYIKIKTEQPLTLKITTTGEVSVFSNVNGELSYIEATKERTVNSVQNTNGYYYTTIPLVQCLKDIANTNGQVQYAHLQNVKIKAEPISNNDNNTIKELAVSSTVETEYYPTIKDVWETENKAYNWTNFTEWIQVALTGFFSFEIMPGISFFGIMSVIVGLSVFVWFLKVFAGG